MNMKQLRYVSVLAEKGSFGRAAEELGISQPSLSQYVKKIEQQIGAALFDRTGGDVRLTDAGRVYVETGKKILDLEHQMQNRLSDIAASKSGTVIIGTSPYRSAMMMPAVVKRFHERYPGVTVVVEEMTTAELTEAAERGRFDLCLTMKPVDERTFCCETIAHEELLLAVPASYPLLPASVTAGRKYPAVDIREIEGSDFVMIQDGQMMRRTLDHICEDHQISLNCVSVVKSLEAQIAMVRAGAGCALASSGVESFCASDEVRFYSFVQDLPEREVIALWRKDRRLNQVTADLLDLLKACFR